MAKDKVLTGAIALIKVKGVVVGKMKSVSYSEQIQRQPVSGLGTIFDQEAPVVKFTATLSCSQYFVDFNKTGIPGALQRDLDSVETQVLTGAGNSFEDQLVLDPADVQIDIFKKMADVLDANGFIRPKLVPIAIIYECLIETNGMDISEGQVAGGQQTFKVLKPAFIPKIN